MNKRKVVAIKLPDFFQISVKTRSGINYVHVHTSKCYSNSTGEGSEIESVMTWLREQVQDNPLAQQALKQIYEADKPFSGVPSIQKHGEVFTVESAGEASNLQLLRALGLHLKAQKSSNRKNAALIGYAVHNEGVELAAADAAA